MSINRPITPPNSWQKFGDIHWYPSDLSEHLFQAIIDIGEGIKLCVEAGGNPEHPPMIFITGLGSQMMFWSDQFLKRFIDAGFLSYALIIVIQAYQVKSKLMAYQDSIPSK